MMTATAAEPAGLRVLFLTHAFPRWTGDAAGSFILRLAKALKHERVDVTVLAPHAAGLARRDTVDAIPVIRFRYAPVSLESLAYVGTMAEQVRGSWSARAALVSLLGASFFGAIREQRRYAVDVLHAHWWFPSGIIAVATNYLTGVPVVTSMHGSDVRLARTMPGARTALGWVMRRSRTTTTVSRWLAGEAHALSPTLAAPLVLPMPAATDLFTAGDSRDPNRLLFVGRLNAQKGIELLLHAIAALRQPTALDVVGDGPDGETLRALASSLGIAERVRWYGALPQQQLPPLYRRAAALIVPSRDEGLGLVAAEAQLCETPVIAFDSGGLRDIIDDGGTGILVKDLTSAALASAIEDLLSNLSRATTIGRAGREAALRTFAPEVVARRYAAVYRDAIRATPRRHDTGRENPQP